MRAHSSMVEQIPLKDKVGGSNPPGRISNSQHYGCFLVCLFMYIEYKMRIYTEGVVPPVRVI